MDSTTAAPRRADGAPTAPTGPPPAAFAAPVIQRRLPVSLDPLPAAPADGTLPAPPAPPFAGLPTPRRCALPALGWQARQARPVRAPVRPGPSVPPPPAGLPVAVAPPVAPPTAARLDRPGTDDRPGTVDPPGSVDPPGTVDRPGTDDPFGSGDRPLGAAPLEPVEDARATAPSRGRGLAVGVLGQAARWASYAVLGAAAWVLVLTTLPRLAGWQPTVITGRSMEPSIERGDVVVVRPAPAAALVAGAVITFRDPNRPGRLITHRVVTVLSDGRLKTKGDHNHDADPTPVAVADVQGRAVLRVPYAGRPVVWAMDHRWVPLGLTVASLVAAVRTAFAPGPRPVRRRRRRARRHPMGGAAPPGQLTP